MARNSGTHSPIDPDATRRFFVERGRKIPDVGALGAVLYQDHQPQLAAQRNEAELARAVPLLAPQSGGHVFDVGCGTGRWASALSPTLASYTGLDFCEDFLKTGAETSAKLPEPDRFNWRVWDVSPGKLPPEYTGKFDLVIVAGVFLYLNDEAVPLLMTSLADMVAPEGKIYIREPLATQSRLTLDKHYSEELKTEYSAIYRTRAEFEKLMREIFTARGFTIDLCDDLYGDVLNNRVETVQRIHILSRAAE